MPRRKVGFLGLELGEVWGLEGVEEEGEERMKTPTPTRTWGGILLGGFFLVFFFLVALGAWVVCLFWEMVVVVIFSCIWE